MGQQEVYDVLKNNKRKWLGARDIANKLNLPFGRVVVNLSRLRRSGIILSKHAYRVIKPAGKRAILIYKYK